HPPSLSRGLPGAWRGAQRFEQRAEIRRVVTCGGDLVHGEKRGVKHLTRGAGSLLPGSIHDVAGDGISGMREGRTDLVQEAGLEIDLDKRRPAQELERPPAELCAA